MDPFFTYIAAHPVWTFVYLLVIGQIICCTVRISVGKKQ